MYEVFLCPSSWRDILNFTVSFVFKKRLPSSASAVDAATPMILHNVCMAPWWQLVFQILFCFQGNNTHLPYYVPWSRSCMTRLSGLVGSFWMQKNVFWHKNVWHNIWESVLHPGQCFLSVQIVASPICWRFWL